MDDSHEQSPAASPRGLWWAARWAFNGTTAISAALALAFVALWVRSHLMPEAWTVTGAKRYAVRTTAGRVTFEEERQFAGRIVEQSPPPAGAVPARPDPGGAAALIGDPMAWPGLPYRGSPAVVTTNTVVEQPMCAHRQWSHAAPDPPGPWPPPAPRGLGVGWRATRYFPSYAMNNSAQAVSGGRYDADGRWHAGASRRLFEFRVTCSHLIRLTVPFWLATMVTAAMPMVRGGWAVRRRRRRAPGHCRRCGYDLRASPERCPECGSPR